MGTAHPKSGHEAGGMVEEAWTLSRSLTLLI
jgi:hypothetical protein